MSDTGRQSLTDKASAAMKPDSEKSTMEHMSDKMMGSADSAGSTMQPNSQKSTTQRMGDAMSGNQNQNNESMMDMAKNAMGMNK